MYTKKSFLGPRIGRGTFDCFYDTTKYDSYEIADKSNDIVIVDFVQDEQGVKYFEIYHSTEPSVKKYLKLEIQHFPFGIDMMDDAAVQQVAKTMFK